MPCSGLLRPGPPCSSAACHSCLSSTVSNPSLISLSPIKASSAPKPVSKPSDFSPQPAPSSFSPEVYPSDDRVPEVSAVTDPVMNSVPKVSALPPTVPGVSYIQMSALQQSCTKVQQLCQSSALKIVSVPVSNFQELLCDISTGIHRPLVPEAMRKNVFNAIHKISHPGKRAS